MKLPCALLPFLIATTLHAAEPARTPAPGAANIAPDTLLTITFDKPPTLGTTGQIRIYDAADDKLVDTLDLAVPLNQQSYTMGGVQFHAYPVMIGGNTATIHPHPGVLAYGKKYYVQTDAGIISDLLPAIGDKTTWTFSTRAAGPKFGGTEPLRLMLAADGSGDFATLQGAIDAVPASNNQPITIFLKKGTYTEIISMVDKANITILGEDRLETILTYPNNEKVQLGQNSSSKRGVVNGLRSKGIAFANMTLRNATPKGTGGGWQAESIIFKNNSQVIITDCNMHSFQDTLQMSSAGYVANCYIDGDVDFKWGTGPCYFRDCQFKAVNNNDAFVVSRNNATTHGFIYLNCDFDTAPTITGSWLANNQGYGNSEVVLLNCRISPSINPIAWRGSGPNVHYWELNSTNTTDGQPADISKRLAGSKQLAKDADAETITNYSNPTFVLGGWTPALAPIITKQPEVKPGQTLAITAAAVGVPAPTWQWFKDGQPIPGATSATLQISHGPGRYTAKATNMSGTNTTEPVSVR